MEQVWHRFPAVQFIFHWDREEKHWTLQPLNVRNSQPEEPEKVSQYRSSGTLNKELFETLVKRHQNFTGLVKPESIIKTVSWSSHSAAWNMSIDPPFRGHDRLKWPIRKALNIFGVALKFLKPFLGVHGDLKWFQFMGSAPETLRVIFSIAVVLMRLVEIIMHQNSTNEYGV